MPKVKDEYIQDKKEQILDAAYRVCMQKPVYSITMRDIIAEIGWSKGAIYRYFKNVHYIMLELINRQTAHLHVKEEVDETLSLPEAPEHILAKMIFEYTALIGIERDLILAQSCRVETHPISIHKDIDPQKLMNVLCRSVIIDSPVVNLTVVGVRTYDEAEVVVKELIADGITTIELCAGFGNDGVARLTKAVEGKTIVGVVRFDLHPAFNHQSGDKMF